MNPEREAHLRNQNTPDGNLIKDIISLFKSKSPEEVSDDELAELLSRPPVNYDNEEHFFVMMGWVKEAERQNSSTDPKLFKALKRIFKDFEIDEDSDATDLEHLAWLFILLRREVIDIGKFQPIISFIKDVNAYNDTELYQ